MLHAKEIIKNLQLIPHPEGGYYKEIYRSIETTKNIKGDIRNVCTSIYYLLENTDKSHFHKINSDELWFFHQGEPVEIVYIEDGALKTIVLGNCFISKEKPQILIPANTWFAAKLKNPEPNRFSLMSCIVAPGFDFRDFELGIRKKLLKEFPNLKDTIEMFTLN